MNLPMAYRVSHLNSLLMREINQILLRDFEFPQGDFLTITRVETSSDVIESKVYISVMPDTETDRIFKILNKLIYPIQQKINQRLKMRPVPKIIFIKESATKEAGKIEELLAKLKKEEK